VVGLQQLVPRRTQFHGEIGRLAEIGMHAFHQMVIGGVNFVFRSLLANADDFERPVGVHVAGLIRGLPWPNPRGRVGPRRGPTSSSEDL
jgi:hypothetical protein